MKSQPTLYGFLLMFVLCLFTGCTSSPKLNEFTFNYTLESVNVYKAEITIKSDKSFKIVKNNLFMNRVQDAKPVYTYEGTLTDKDFDRIKSLIEKTNLFSMNDAYGFTDESIKNREDLLVQLMLNADGKEKYISIRDNKLNNFDRNFSNLVKYMNDFITRYDNRV